MHTNPLLLFTRNFSRVLLCAEYDFTSNSDALKSEMFSQLLDGFAFIALDENENILVS